MAVAIIVNMIHIFNYLLERLQYQAFLLNSSACSRRSEATTSATVNSKASSQRPATAPYRVPHRSQPRSTARPCQKHSNYFIDEGDWRKFTEKGSRKTVVQDHIKGRLSFLVLPSTGRFFVSSTDEFETMPRALRLLYQSHREFKTLAS